MAQTCFRVRLPQITHVCCGYFYNTKDVNTVSNFRCFAHKSTKNSLPDNNGILKKVKFCITIWLMCKNNGCITSFTFFMIIQAM